MRIDRFIQDRDKLLYDIALALDAKLAMEDNLFMKQVTVTSHATPGTTFTVTHSLGKVPHTWIAMPQANCTVWEVNRSGWTSSTMQLRCSGSSVTIVLTIL